jgi:hypothetical protein
MEPFVPITEEEKKLNIPSGLLSFSDGHFFDKVQDYGGDEDLSQNIINVSDEGAVVLYSGSTLNVLDSGTPILTPSGLIFQDINKDFNENSIFSNSKKSRDLSITDFTIFNTYIHYLPNTAQLGVITDNPEPLAVKIDTSSFLNEATTAFNIYNTNFR